MSKLSPKSAFLFATVSSCSLLSQTAAAQSMPEIIVTATKLEKSSAQIGASISVIDGEELSSFNGAEDLTTRVSGLQAAVANGSQIAFQIRGVGAVDHQALTPTAAAVYVDGVYMATNVQTSPLLFDMHRAEVLRGPQGSLYGRNASGGAINFISVEPGDEPGGYVSAAYGSFDRININAAATLPVSDIFSLRLAGRYLSQDGTQKNISANTDFPAANARSFGTRDEFGLRAIGKLKVNDETTAVFNAHYAEDNGINAAPLNSALSLGKHETSLGPDGVQDTDNEFYGLSARIDHESGAYTLTSQTSYEGYNQFYGFDFDGSQAPFDVASLNANLRYDRDFTQVSQELRLSRVSEKAEFMAGVYLEAEDFYQEYLIWCGELDTETLLGTCRYVGAPGRAGPTPASAGTATTLRTLISQSRETAALFTFNTVEIAPKLDIVFGGRLTYENIKGRGQGLHIFDDGLVALNNRDGLGLAIGSNRIKDTRLTGNLGLNYQLNDQTLLYASASNGYKSGGFNGEVINNATHFTDEGLFGSESVEALETGVKYSNETFGVNLTGFYQFYDNPQARIFVPFSLANGGSFTSNSLSNLDRARSYGVEADMRWSPVDDLVVTAATTWLDTKIKQDVDPNVPQNAATFDGNPLPFASEFSGVLSVRYKHPISDTLDGYFDISGKYQTSFFLDAEGLEDRHQAGYEIIDGRLGLKFSDSLDVGIWAKNITNSDYATSGFGFIGYNTFKGDPRTYGVSATYTY